MWIGKVDGKKVKIARVTSTFKVAVSSIMALREDMGYKTHCNSA
jgi:hypothetical protein